MNVVGSTPEGKGALAQWAKVYVAFLGFAALILLILLAKGLYLALALIAGAVIGVAVLVRRFGNHLR